MNEQEPTKTTMLGLSVWAVGYAFRRWLMLGAVVGTMLLKTAIELLKPWPMVILVDHFLQKKPMSGALDKLIDSLPGSSSISNLILLTVAATIVIFLFGWVAQVADAYANISFGQRIVYDLAGDLFTKLQQLSLRFHRQIRWRQHSPHHGGLQSRLGHRQRRHPAAHFGVRHFGDDVCHLVAHRPDVDTFFHRSGSLHGAGLFHLRKADDGTGLETTADRRTRLRPVEQTFAAIPIVQAFGRERDNERRLQTNLKESLTATLALTNVQLQFKLLMGLATAVGTTGVLWIGSRHGLAGTISIGRSCFSFPISARSTNRWNRSCIPPRSWKAPQAAHNAS